MNPRFTVAPNVALPAILLLGLVLRLYGLGTWQLGLDEAYTANVAVRGVQEIIRFIAVDDSHPPLHYVLVHYWRQLVGTSEVLLRLPSVAFGVAGIWIVYKLAESLIDNRVGLVAAFIVAMSPLHIFHSQELRFYPLIFFLGTASLYFFARMLQGGGRRDWWGYWLTTVLALHTHYSAFLIVTAANLAYVVLLVTRSQRIRLWAWIGMQGAVLIATLPWMTYLAANVSNLAPATFGRDLPVGLNPASVPQIAYVLSALTSYSLPMGMPLLKAGVATLFGATAAAGALALRRNWPAMVILLASSFGAIAAAALTVGASAIAMGTFIFIPRTLIATTAGYYTLIATAVVRLRMRWLATMLLITLAVLHLSAFPAMYAGVARSGPWREVVKGIASDFRDGDSIVFVSGFWARVFDFYFAQTGITTPVLRYGGGEHQQGLAHLVDQSQRVWLVTKQPRSADPEGKVKSLIASKGTLQMRKAYAYGIDVELWVLR